MNIETVPTYLSIIVMQMDFFSAVENVSQMQRVGGVTGREVTLQE